MKVLVAAVMLVSLLSGCAGQVQPFDAVEAPQLQSGYAYAYEVEGHVKGDAVARVNGEVEEEEHIDESFGPGLMVYNIISTRFGGDDPFYLAAAQVEDVVATWLSDTSDWGSVLALRQRDLMTLPATLDQGGLTVDDADAMETYLDFPLTPGKTWTSQLPGGATIQDDSLPAATSSKALRMENVDLANGTVRAVLVKTTISVPGLDQFVKDAERQMKEAGFDEVDIRMSLSGTVLTWYAPSIQNVVREIAHVVVSIQLDIVDEGERASARAKAEIRVEARLAGADLSPQADRDPAVALAYLANGGGVRDPTGRLDVVDGDYAIDVVLDADRINAAADEAFAFHVTGAPAGHTLGYALFDAHGKEAASGEAAAGGTHRVTPPGPGSYTLRVRAYDGGDLQAQDAVAVVADWEQTLDVACPVAAGTTRTCFAHGIPSGIDLQRMRIDFAGGSALGVVPSPGNLAVSDATGGRIEAAASMGSATIDRNDFGSLDPTSQWTVTWEPTVGVAEQGTIDVSLEYSPSASSGDMPAMRLLRSLDIPHLQRIL